LKIILLKDNTAKNGAFCLSGHKLLISGVAILLALPVFLGLATYWVVSAIDRSLNPFVDPQYRIAVESRVNEQQQEMLKTRDYVRPIGGAADSETVDSEQIDIENAIVAIEKELSLRESEIAAVDFLLSRNSLETQQTPAGWPVEGGWVSSNFGTRLHPISGKKQFHRGVDIPGKEGSSVLAVADGVVIRSQKSSTFGWVVELDHGDSYTTLYSHNKKNLVSQGETVVKGQAIAQIGSTGRATGPHVHFEVAKNKRSINPIRYLYKKS